MVAVKCWVFGGFRINLNMGCWLVMIAVLLVVVSSRWRVEAERWLRGAVEDLPVAENLLRTLHYAASCFHSAASGGESPQICLTPERY